MLLQKSAQELWRALTVDVRTAFLQSDPFTEEELEKNPVYVEWPQNDGWISNWEQIIGQEPDTVLLALKPVYGLNHG